MTDKTAIPRAQTAFPDETEAVADLTAQLDTQRAGGELAGAIFFCSPHYDLDRLAGEFARQLDGCFPAAGGRGAAGHLIGCTTAGEIGERYASNGISALGLRADQFAMHTLILDDLDVIEPERLRARLARIRDGLRYSDDFDPEHSFAFLLIDGLSMKEELVAATLQGLLPGLPMLGGSAADALRFKGTRVFADGAFRAHRAVLAIIESRLDFELFKLQHFVPTETDMVVTESEPTRRRVSEINGAPAVAEYARIIGVDPGKLDPDTFSRYPVMLEIGDEWYVRSIEKAHADGSLSFSCTIDTGLPLTLARSQGLLPTLKRQVDDLHARFRRIDATLGCDCVLRRLEMLAHAETHQVEHLLHRLKFVGFNTYGEQFNGIHVNQTMVGVVLGEKIQ